MLFQTPVEARKTKQTSPTLGTDRSLTKLDRVPKSKEGSSLVSSLTLRSLRNAWSSLVTSRAAHAYITAAGVLLCAATPTLSPRYVTDK